MRNSLKTKLLFSEVIKARKGILKTCTVKTETMQGKKKGEIVGKPDCEGEARCRGARQEKDREPQECWGAMWRAANKTIE